jgi:hypothetical protein
LRRQACPSAAPAWAETACSTCGHRCCCSGAADCTQHLRSLAPLLRHLRPPPRAASPVSAAHSVSLPPAAATRAMSRHVRRSRRHARAPHLPRPQLRVRAFSSESDMHALPRSTCGHRCCGTCDHCCCCPRPGLPGDHPPGGRHHDRPPYCPDSDRQVTVGCSTASAAISPTGRPATVGQVLMIMVPSPAIHYHDSRHFKLHELASDVSTALAQAGRIQETPLL